MRFEYIEPFVNSTKNVLKGVLRSDVTSGRTSLVEGGVINGEVMIIVHVAGESQGSVILSMDSPTAVSVCTAMSGSTCMSLTSEGLDIMAELANMITGNATSVLNDLGYDFSVFPPIVLAATQLREKTAGVEMVRIPIRSVYGEINVNVAMRTN